MIAVEPRSESRPRELLKRVWRDYSVLLVFAAIIVVSSDLPEILAICERVVVMHEGRVTGTLKASELSEAKVMYYATDVV